MSKKSTILEEKIVPIAGRIAEQRHLQAIRDGLALGMPVLITGSIFLVLGFLPIKGYNEFMAGIFGQAWLTKLLYPVGATFDIMAIYASIGIAYRLAQSYNVDPLQAGALSLASFLLATPFNVLFQPEGIEEAFVVGGVIPKVYMGSKGLFVAIIIAILSTEIYRFIIQKDIVIKMPEGVPPAVSKSFTALIPSIIAITAVWLLRIGIEATSFENIHEIIGTLLQKPLSAIGASLTGAVICVFLIGFFWSFGLHGYDMVGAVMSPIWLALLDENRMAFQANPNAVLPNIISSQFFLIFIFLGGAGATLALALLSATRSKSKQLRNLGNLSFWSSLFNINEPVIFGTPIVMNPILAIPFILVPIILTIVTYVSMKVGFVAKPIGISVPWTTPIGISGYLATGGKISGAVIQIINLILAVLIYYPFFKSWDNKLLEQESKND